MACPPSIMIQGIVRNIAAAQWGTEDVGPGFSVFGGNANKDVGLVLLMSKRGNEIRDVYSKFYHHSSRQLSECRENDT